MSMVTLGEIVEIKGGGTPDKSVSAYWGGDIPWASVKDFKSTEIADTVDYITEQGAANSATNIIPADSILVPTRMAVGKAAINTVAMAINQDLKALTPKRGVDLRYLLHALLAKAPELERQATGATVKGIKLGVLRSLQIPLPSLEEQKRIAAILDQADEVRRTRQRTIERLNTLSQSIFYEMLADELASDDWLPLGELVNEFRYGTSNKSSSEGYPSLRIPNIIGGDINLDDLKTVVVTEKEFDRLKLVAGDLLFVRTNGNPSYVGRCSVVPDIIGNKDAGSFIYASYLIRARLHYPETGIFLSAFLESAVGRKQLLENAKTSAGQYNINIEGLSSINVPNVSADKQKLFRNRILNIREPKISLSRHFQRLGELFASLQQRAFRGEL